MPTLADQIARARRLCGGIDTSQYSAAAALEDANVVIHKIEDYIVDAIGEGFFWDVLTADNTVVGQSEYAIPQATYGLFEGSPKLESVSIKYDEDGEYLPCRKGNRQQMLAEHDLSWYEENQSPADPVFFIADNSIFVYPAPTVEVEDGIKYYGIKNLADVTASTDYDDLFAGKIPQKYYYLISEGLKQYIKATIGDEQGAEALKNIFELELLPMLVNKLGNREVGITPRQEPDMGEIMPG